MSIFADAPVDVAVVEVGLGGTWDATNVDRRRGRGRHADRPRSHAVPRARRGHDRRGEGRDHQAGRHRGARRAAAGGRRRSCCGAPSRSRPSVAREGLEFGVLRAARRRRRPGAHAAGAGRRRTTRCSCRCTASTRRRTRCARLPRSRRSSARALAGGPIDAEVVRAAFAAVRSPGRLEAVRSAPTILVDAAHNPRGMAATVAADRARRSTSAGSSQWSASSPTRTSPACCEQLEPVVDELVVTQNSSLRAMPCGRAGGARGRRLRSGPGDRRAPAGRRDRDGGATGRGHRRRRAVRRRRARHRVRRDGRRGPGPARAPRDG